MKPLHKGFYLVLVWILLSSGVIAKDLATPVQVDVYPRGADLTWELDAEQHFTIFLPSSFSPDRLSFREHDGAQVFRMSVTQEGSDGWIPADLRPLVRQITDKKQILGELKADLFGVIQTIDYVKSGIDLGNTENPFDSIADLRSLRVTSEKEKLALEEQIKQVSAQVQELTKTLGLWYRGDLDSRHLVTFSTNGVGSLDFKAYSPYAEWSPSYRASLDSNKGVVDLETHVAVRQQTGISWEGEVICHTAAPLDHVMVPRIRPLVAREQEVVQQPAPRSRSTQESLMVEMPMEITLFDAKFDMQQVESEVGISLFGQGKVDTDGKNALLSVSKDSFPVDVRATLIPYQQDMAWLLSTTKKPARTFLSGPVDLMVDGFFTGTSQLAHSGGGEVMEMAFGNSPLITAERKPMVYTETKTWLGRRIVRDGYTIVVHNGSSRDATVTVKDRVPMSGHDKISIKVTLDPKPLEEENGILSWELDLPAGSHKTISVDYEIDHPDKMRLIIR